MKKYELIKDDTVIVDDLAIDAKIVFNNSTLYRIRALRDFDNVRKGDIGGFLASEDNLSHRGDCWVSGNAQVYGSALVYGNAHVSDDAQVFGDAWVSGDAHVFGHARVFGDIIINTGNYDFTPVSITRSDGYTFTIQDNGRIIARCRDFSSEEADEYWGDPEHQLHEESMIILNALRELQKFRK